MSHLTEAHIEMLAEGAIPTDVAEAAGAYSVSRSEGMPPGISWGGPGLVFQYHPLDGDPVPQYRPDAPKPGPDGTIRKYVFPKGGVPLNIVPTMRDRIGGAATILIVEGTKQTLAAVAHAPDDVLVVGMAGCWGFSTDGKPDPALGHLGIDGCPVVIALDADHATNSKVWEAGSRLAEHLELLGAAKVTFLKMPASGSVGLDDFLATVPDPAAVLARLIAKAGKLGRKPKAAGTGSGAKFFDHDGLLVEDVAAAILENGDYAVGPDGATWQYVGGVYVDNDPMVGAVRTHLGNRFRDLHLRNIKMVVADELRRLDLVLGDQETVGLINCRNGMLRVATGELEPHDPAHLSRTQLAIDWNPAATAPTFDTWLTDRCGTQSEDLLEAAGLMLCPWVGQRRVVFLFGPSRSGKSTFLRLLEALAGHHKAAVTLHQLGTNRFAAASLYGRLLNIAGDLSDHHIDDLSLFKQLTGDDLVAGERKFRDQFTFRNRALFVFSANQPPTVSETSRGYLARVRPFLFPRSVEGHEDTSTDDRLAAELPGVLVRLVEGAQRWIDRGGYLPGDPMVADEFAQQSDVAALFASEVVAADKRGFTSGQDMFDAYRDWADANGRGRLGRNKFLKRLDSTLGDRQRAHGLDSGPTGWRNVRVLPADQWVDPDPLARFAFFTSTSPSHEEISGEESPSESQNEGIPREGEVGPERANRATGGSDPNPSPVTVPDDDIELDF